MVKRSAANEITLAPARSVSGYFTGRRNRAWVEPTIGPMPVSAIVVPPADAAEVLDAGVLEVAEVDDVVDVPERIHVAPGDGLVDDDFELAQGHRSGG